MSYGYQPPKQDKPGSWGEVFAITRVAFELLLPFFAAIVGLLLTIILTILLFAQHPALGLIPLIPIALVIAFFTRRGRREHEDELSRIRGR